MFIRQNIPLAGYTTYKIGGIARYFTEIKNGEDAIQALKFAKKFDLSVFFLGGGSNILVSDRGFSGLAVRVKNEDIKIEGNELEAGAGTELDEVVDRAAEAGLKGLEWAAGIPGTIGGAVRGNAGAFGGEIKDIIKSVRILRPWGRHFILQPVTKEACGFSYRSSVFKRENNLIFSAKFSLKGGNSYSLKREIRERRRYRAGRHPLEHPNVGSVFKNISDPAEVEKIKKLLPEVRDKIESRWHGKVAAAFLIENLGLKGKELGGMAVSGKHANFIINADRGRAEEVVALMSLIKSRVSHRFNIRLEPEVQMIFS